MGMCLNNMSYTRAWYYVSVEAHMVMNDNSWNLWHQK